MYSDELNVNIRTYIDECHKNEVRPEVRYSHQPNDNTHIFAPIWLINISDNSVANEFHLKRHIAA